MVTIEKTGTDVCALTGKQGEGVYCKFADGFFQGFRCGRAFGNC